MSVADDGLITVAPGITEESTKTITIAHTNRPLSPWAGTPSNSYTERDWEAQCTAICGSPSLALFSWRPYRVATEVQNRYIQGQGTGISIPLGAYFIDSSVYPYSGACTFTLMIEMHDSEDTAIETYPTITPEIDSSGETGISGRTLVISESDLNDEPIVGGSSTFELEFVEYNTD
jgi:hypothetical protein